MFEDATTHSWWRQENGVAIAGKLKGQQLPEVFSTQTSLAQWLKLNPNSLVMQADPAHLSSYDSTMKFESGASRNELTGTDSLSWKDKSWVIGVKTGKDTRAYDWNQLKEERVIMDTTANPALFVVLSADNRSFSAFERPSGGDTIQISNDTILYNNRH
jgi:hypothetical protein